jgi:hypothetical protein
LQVFEGLRVGLHALPLRVRYQDQAVHATKE